MNEGQVTVATFTVLYGCAGWTLTKADEKALQTAQRNIYEIIVQLILPIPLLQAAPPGVNKNVNTRAPQQRSASQRKMLRKLLSHKWPLKSELGLDTPVHTLISSEIRPGTSII